MEIDADYAKSLESFSEKELRQVFRGIDRDRFPGRYNAIIIELQKRNAIAKTFSAEDHEQFHVEQPWSEYLVFRRGCFFLFIGWCVFLGIIRFVLWIF